MGDCLEKLNTIPDESIDLVLTDLPYGITDCKWDTTIDLDLLWQQYLRVAKGNAAFVFTCAQPFTSVLGNSQKEILRYEWIWEKPQGTNPLNAARMPLRNHENILVFYREQPTYNPQIWYSTPYSGFSSNEKKIGEIYGRAKSKHRDNKTGERFPITVLSFPQEKGLHPTQKPVALMEYLIRTYSNENDIVLDSCMGSGTTGIACMQNERKFIGIELDKEYYELAVDRINDSVGLRGFFSDE